MQFTRGMTVRPANDGENSRRTIIKWTKLTGTVVDSWIDCGEERVQVRWNVKNPYPVIVPAYFLIHA